MKNAKLPFRLSADLRHHMGLFCPGFPLSESVAERLFHNCLFYGFSQSFPAGALPQQLFQICPGLILETGF